VHLHDYPLQVLVQDPGVLETLTLIAQAVGVSGGSGSNFILSSGK
jgi:hypothetical protein